MNSRAQVATKARQSQRQGQERKLLTAQQINDIFVLNRAHEVLPLGVR